MNEQPNPNYTQAPVNNTGAAPAPAKKSNTALIVVIIIIVAIFFLFIGGIFFFSMFVVSLTNDMDTSGRLPDSSINLELPTIDDEPEEDDVSSIVAGTWDCYNYEGAPVTEDGFEATLKLTRGGSYVFGEYGNEDVNHYKGTYEALDLKKQNASGDFNYYSLDFTTDEFVLDGEESSTQLSDAEVGITEKNDSREMILAFESSGNLYYCIER